MAGKKKPRKKPAPKPAARKQSKVPAKQRAKQLLEAYADTCNIVKACRKAKVARQNHYRWLRKNPEYAAAFNERKQQAADLLESIAVERAAEGYLEPVLYQGQVAAHVRRFSDGLMMFLLRGMMPEKYGVQRQEISGPQGTPMQAKIEIVVVKPDGTRHAPGKQS